MHTIKELEKQQVGLRMPAYLLEEIDEARGKYKVNRSEFLIEATQSYLKLVKEREFYEDLRGSMQEAKLMIDGKIPSKSARSLLDEL